MAHGPLLVPQHLDTVVEIPLLRRRLAVPEARKDRQQSSSNAGKAILTDIGEDTVEGIRLYREVDGGWGQRGVQAEQVSGKASDVGGSHGGSGHIV